MNPCSPGHRQEVPGNDFEVDASAQQDPSDGDPPQFA